MILTNENDNEIYNYPITIRRALPDGWSAATVKQNDKQVNATTLQTNDKKYVIFDVVPDAGDVVLSRIQTMPIM